MNTIETRNLSIGYVVAGRTTVVTDSLDLKLSSGSVTCLLGLNGAGKSTLIRTICGFQKPLSGEILIDGKSLKSFSQSELSLIVGVVLTEKTNAGGISVYELVSLGRHPYTDFFGRLKKEDHDIILSSLEAVGISHKASAFVSELSDGERQKAMIAKVLAQQCKIIVLDEPTAFLDVTSRIETMALLRKLAKEQGKTVLLSTHDLELAIQMADCLWLQQQGGKMAVGAPEDLILKGVLGEFFNRGGISFDATTGKLNATPTDCPIGIEGDFITSYWMGNAMIRNGFRPSEISPSYTRIVCNSPSDFKIISPSGNTIAAGSVQEVIEAIPLQCTSGQ